MLVRGKRVIFAISTRAPRTEGDHGRACCSVENIRFQPAPPARRATTRLPGPLGALRFQPAPPARRATRPLPEQRYGRSISTRAPRTEGDIRRRRPEQPSTNFNPRPPHGGRLVMAVEKDDKDLFQPAPPARRATTNFRDQARPRPDFNPRPPHGGRRTGEFDVVLTRTFQPAPPARRATGWQ